MTTYDLQTRTIIYPESDDEPVAETDDHRELMFALIFALKHWLRTTTAYVAGNLFVYYVEGHPELVVAPDVFVVFGVPQRNRRTYMTWQNSGKNPDLVIELTSSKTKSEDLGKKRVLYAELGVQEYFIFDPLDDHLVPRLRRFQLIDGELIPDTSSRVISRLLNLELRPDGAELRFYDLATGLALPTPYEIDEAREREAEARRQEAHARERETEARRAAEAEAERLRAEIERLRGSQ
jgi:Uma2 family endonuclease